MSESALLVWWPSQQEVASQKDAGLNLRVRYEIRGGLAGKHGGRRLQGGTALLRDLPRNLDCTVLLDPRHVLLLKTLLPRLNPRQLREGLAFLVEAQLISAPEDNWVAAQGKLDTGTDEPVATLVSAVDRLTVRNVLLELADSGLQVRTLSVEPLVLTAPNRPAWLICQPDGAWICAPSAVPWFLPMTDDAGATPLLAWWQQNRPASVREWLVINADETQKQRLAPYVDAVAWADRSALVLRTAAGALVPADEIRRARAGGRRSASPWRAILRLSLLLALCWLIGLNAYAWQQQRALNAIDAQIDKAFQTALPGTPKIADPILLMQRRKTELLQGQRTHGAPEFSRLFHQAGLALAELPFNVVESVDYQPGHLTLVLNTAPNTEQRTHIDSNFKSQQLNAQWTQDPGKRTALKISAGNGL